MGKSVEETVSRARARRPADGDRARRIETIARAAYDRCHRDDTFDDMKRRAAFSREDQGLLADWLAYARRQVVG